MSQSRFKNVVFWPASKHCVEWFKWCAYKKEDPSVLNKSCMYKCTLQKRVLQFYKTIWSQSLTKEVYTQYRMTNREQPNELQLGVYVQARMRTPVVMETVVCLPLSSMTEQVETVDLLSEMMQWLALWWGCQTNPRKHCPTTLTSCHTLPFPLCPSILPFFLEQAERFYEWEHLDSQRGQQYVEQTDMIAVKLLSMKEHFIQPVSVA